MNQYCNLELSMERIFADTNGGYEMGDNFRFNAQVKDSFKER